jgi:RNA polymerase sigma-70 factor (ECF subfamily)
VDLPEFDRLYAQHAQRIYAFLAYRTGDDDLAEDLLSEVFERALRFRSRFDRRRGTEEAWLYAIALNLIRDRARRRAVETKALRRVQAERTETVDGPGEQLAERQAVLQAVRGLGADDRELIALRFGADLTVPQIAGLLEVPVTTVEGRLHRTMNRLRERLSG